MRVGLSGVRGVVFEILESIFEGIGAAPIVAFLVVGGDDVGGGVIGAEGLASD